MNNELTLIAACAGIEISKAEQIDSIFMPMVEMLKSFESSYDTIMEKAKEEINIDVVQAAKRIRIDIGRIRIDTEKARKEQKEEYLRAGKAIDGVANILKFAVVEKEQKLKDIENYYENIEKERVAKIQSDREFELSKYDFNCEVDLASMPDEVWENYLTGYRLSYEKKKEAEEKAEIERIEAEEAEKKRRLEIEAENKRLKAESEKREVEENKRKEKEAKEKATREKSEAELEKQRQQEREKLEKQIQKEKEEKKKIEDELNEKKAQEIKKIEEIKAQEKACKLAPDRDKLLKLAEDIESINFPMVEDANAAIILQQARERLNKTYSDLKEQSKKL